MSALRARSRIAPGLAEKEQSRMGDRELRCWSLVRRLAALSSLLLCMNAGLVQADTCASIVDAALSELRAGSAAWSDEAEQLSRAAAGSACVKSLSGRYSGSSIDASCEAVVSETIAEIRAGASGSWSTEPEQLVRRASASACFKASSGRYAATNDGERSDEEDEAPAAARQTATASSADATAGDKDDGSWSFGGLTFRALSGSPSRKPYERQRSPAKKDDSEE